MTDTLGRLAASLPLLMLVSGSAGLGWWLAPPLEEPQSLVQARRSSWALRDLPVRAEATPVAGRVMMAPFWGGAEVVAGVQPPENLRWRVAAIYGAEGKRTLRVEFRDPSKPAKTLRVGDYLPSGNKIMEINERDYCVQVDGRGYTMGVERSE